MWSLILWKESRVISMIEKLLETKQKAWNNIWTGSLWFLMNSWVKFSFISQEGWLELRYASVSTNIYWMLYRFHIYYFHNSLGQVGGIIPSSQGGNWDMSTNLTKVTQSGSVTDRTSETKISLFFLLYHKWSRDKELELHLRNNLLFKHCSFWVW